MRTSIKNHVMWQELPQKGWLYGSFLEQLSYLVLILSLQVWGELLPCLDELLWCHALKRTKWSFVSQQTNEPVALKYIENITWPCRDTKFPFKCWKNLRVSIANKWNICQAAMWYSTYYINTNGMPTSFNFAVTGAIYYVTIATAISSYVKIRCYLHVWRYHVFKQKLTWYIIGV